MAVAVLFFPISKTFRERRNSFLDERLVMAPKKKCSQDFQSQRDVPDMISTRVKTTLPPLSNIFNFAPMKPKFTPPFSKKRSKENKGRAATDDSNDEPEAAGCTEGIFGESSSNSSQTCVKGGIFLFFSHLHFSRCWTRSPWKTFLKETQQRGQGQGCG